MTCGFYSPERMFFMAKGLNKKKEVKKPKKAAKK